MATTWLCCKTSARFAEQTQRPRHPLGGDRQAREARARRVLVGVGDGGGGRADGRLAHAARVEGAEPFAGLDDDRLPVGYIGGPPDPVSRGPPREGGAGP